MMLNLKIQDEIRILSPAKITPILQVLRRRPDGYHDVRIVLVPVSVYDEILLQPGAAGRLTLEVDGQDDLGAPERNLALRAAEAFGEAVGVPMGLHIQLKKRIPAGAGLGGGSGNAAGILVALNRETGLPLSSDQLLRIALSLGSDVPFFLDPKPCVAEGRGEKLTSLSGFPDLAMVLVKPQFSVGTETAYQMVESVERPGSLPELGSVSSLAQAIENDFQSSMDEKFPELKEIRERLLALGALAALLSGTGSAVFGLFGDLPTRDTARSALAVEGRWWVEPCRSLQNHRYPNIATHET